MNYKTLSRFVALLTLPLLVCSAFAATHKPELPNFDKRAAKVLTMSAARKAEADTIASKVKDAKVSTDPISGGPSFVGSTREFLTGKNGKGKSVSDATADSIADNDPHKPAKTFLKEHTAMFGFGPEALDAAKVNKDYMTKAGNFRTVIWQQHIDDIPVFEGTFKAHWTADGQLINVSSQFISGLAKASGKVANRKTLQSNPPISAKQAIVLAAANIGDTVTTSDISEVDQPQGNEKKQHFRGGKVLNDVHARLTWMPLDDSTVQLCWQVVLVSRARGEMFSVLVDAQNGNIWLRQSLTFYLSPVSLNVFTGDSPTPFSPSWSTPNTNQPAVVSRTLTSISAISSTGSPDGWINDGDNTTAGNNVDAHLDVNNDDIADDGSRPVGNPARVFDFPLDLSQEPSTYTNAAVVNLFYWNNWMHDVLYDYGFDEASGNFQNSNFGRGGEENDGVQADAQDASIVDEGGFPNPNPAKPQYNNANFAAAFDGIPGRMQMYVYQNGTAPHRDGDLDSQTMRHEYTHGLSGRLVGGGVGIRDLQTAGMGEGWSDFVSLSLGHKNGDDPNATYSYGAYTMYNFINWNYLQNYYFGARRYPYSTDLTKNPLTFKDIDTNQYSAHIGVPKNPLFGTAYRDDADEVHSIGEVWCAMLWDCRASMIARYGSINGNQKMLQLVIDGMKLSQNNPTFLQSRDAILQADLLINNAADHDILWAAFAKRGLGYNATSPFATTTVGVVEDYTLPPAYMTVLISSPTEGRYYTSTPTASGTSTVPDGNGSSIVCELQRTSDGGIFDYITGQWDATFNPTNNLITASGVANWTMGMPTLADGEYALSVRAIYQNQYAGNYSVRYFKVDHTAPTISFSPLTNVAPVFDLTQIGGIVNKPETVSFRIMEPGGGGTNRYWNGSTFIATNPASSTVWLNANVSGTSWTAGTNALPTRAQTKSYTAYFLDVAGYDDEFKEATNQIIVIRTYDDTTPPAVTIDSIAPNQIITNNYLPGVFGNATDPETGIGNIDIYLMQISGGNFLYWTGGSWTSTPTALHPSFPSGGGQYTLSGLPSGGSLPNGTYQLQVYAQNRETPAATQGTSVSFTVDYHPVFVWTEGSYTDGISGNEDHRFDNPANWDQLTTPSADAIVIVNGGTCDATAMGSMNLYGLTVSNGTFSTLGLYVHKLNVAAGTLSGGAINIDSTNGVFNWSGGTIGGTYGFLAGSTVNMFGNTKTFAGGGTVLNNAGTINWTNGPMFDYGYNIGDIATINNQSNGTFNVYSDAQIFNNQYNPSIFNNLAGAHLVKLSGTGTNQIGGITLNNSGDVHTITGTFEFSGMTMNLSDGSAEGGAIVLDANGRLNCQGATTISNGVFSLQNCTLHGDANSSFTTTNGTLEWTGGSLDGVVEIAPHSQFALTGDATKTFNGGAVLRNFGDVIWSGLGNIYNYGYNSGSQGTILNFSGANFYALSDAAITRDYNESYFTNYAGASFIKASGTGTNTISWQMNNNGLVLSRFGTIHLNAGGTSSGEFSANPGTFVRFTGGNHFLNDGTVFSGAGNIQINGYTTVTRNGTINGGSTSPTILDLISGTFDGTGSLAQKFTMNWTGGTVGGTLNVGSAVTVNLTGSASKSLGANAQFNNFGTVNWSGPGIIYNYGYYGGTQSFFVNESNAVFNMLTDGTVFQQDYNRSYFTNLAGGLIAKIAGSGTNVINGFGVENFGQIRAIIGTIQFPDLLDLNNGSTVNGNGTVLFSGSVNMNAPISNSGNIVLNAGTLTGAVSTNGAALSSYSGTGTFNWTGGAIAGRFVLLSGNTLGITGSNNKTLGSAAFFDNFGTVNWSGPGSIYNSAYYGGQQATFNNYSNAMLNLLTDGTVFLHDNQESYFTNFAGAVVAKIAGGGTNIFNSFLFENSGEVRAQTGQILFNDVLDLLPGSKLTGAGEIHFAGNVSLYGTMQGNAATVALDSQNFNCIVGSNATYTGTSPFTWNAGTINGTLTLQAGNTINVTGTSDKSLGTAAILNNNGTINWSGPGRINNNAYYGGQQATINNRPNANFNLLTDGEVFINSYNLSWFTNEFGAHFTKMLGTGTNVIHSFTMYDFGEVRAQSGIIQFTDQLDINQGAAFTGAGVSQLASGTATLHGQMDVNGGTFQLIGGTFTGDLAGTPSISTENGGVFEWWGGALNGSLKVNSGSTFNMLGNAEKDLDTSTVLNNAGTITWNGNGNLYNNAYYGGQEATINNLSGGLIDLTGNGNLTHSYSPSTLNNNAGATFRKSGASTNSCDWNFQNSGTLDLRNGSFANTALTLASNSIVNITLTGPGNNAQLSQNTSINLAGALNLLNDAVTLTSGLSFTLANYSSETGTFSPVALPALPTRWNWKLNYGPTALTATIVDATVLGNPVSMGNGQFKLSLSGAAASAAVLQSSLSLTNWTSIYTNSPFTGVFDFNDTPAPDETNKFYRILIVP